MIEDNIIDAIVPIYCDGGFNGTGFIYKSYLITAAHVVENLDDIGYFYQGNYYTLDEVNRIYIKQKGKERDGYGRIIFNALAEDLAIYRIDTHCDIFELSNKQVRDGTCSALFGYHYIDEDNNPLKYGIVEIYNSCNLEGAVLFPQDYCMYCKKLENSFTIIRGYSGGPLVVGHTVVGMLIESMTIDGYYHIMKSKRIWDMINNNERDTD